ncbi:MULTISPECIES: hypothetical protein [Clostridium]|uniref:hypothetical protein n=1 Tax=Clostridium TaxID=1485 RepID=UPI00051C936C|nr:MULTISPECIES: hypothetical protein [Clostridium]KJZ85859.1 hypothetical protein ClosIBUN22A_CONTIG69g01390 [Clostridium sp. IBUN22A]KJZ88783.1 hypothetical protein ClosIBUN125C_CONTIG19g01277 [Clostridium sp. IBUN125C]KJZ97231.1 hypothetical protein ClosIBUN13A_CONTIG122g01964 [Clostridium sp. IBUN13A]QUF85279.1 hypothetical protein KDJ93_19670 [Clostridium butyricum]
MEKFGTVLAVVGTIIFIVSIWMLFGYLYFKKGSIKKGLLLLLVSLLLVAGGVVIGVQGAWNNAEKGISLSQEVIDIVETTSAEQATKEQQSKVGSSVFLKINEDDWTKYEDKIKDYYVAWQKSLNPQADDETIRTEFKNLREQALLK